MIDQSAVEGSGPEIVVLGTLPPPVTGMTLFTERVVGGLQAAGPVELHDWSSRMKRHGLVSRLRRIGRVLRSLVKVVFSGRVHNRRMYLVANSSGGLYFTAAIASVGARLGYSIYLHHHVYSYIDRYDWRMAWIDRCMARRGTHIVYCLKMEDDFKDQYASRCGFMHLLPSIVSIDLGHPRLHQNTPLCLGHLSNLTAEKGLDLVIATFQQLRDTGRHVVLKLAGPVRTGAARRLLSDALRAHPESVQYLGPVYNGDKAHFFHGIDVFLFPTRYRNESWGIVLHEALAAAAPVITFDRGCTTVAVGDRAGLIVGRDVDYVSAAASQIERWIDFPDEYRAASKAAVEQADRLHKLGEHTLQQFIAHMFSNDGFDEK